MKNELILLATFLMILGCSPTSKTWKLEDIRIRDPFVLADASTQTYYLYAQMDNRIDKKEDTKGVEVYKSRDLRTWEGPYPVLVLPDSFWARDMVWAPEVHEYFGAYYLFVTLTSADSMPAVAGRPPQRKRGTHVFVAESPEGPFAAFSDQPHTPPDWMALDGTFWKEDYQPWMVFCREWWQIEDGTMELVKLKKDLSDVDGEPMTLFTAHSAPWVRAIDHANSSGYVTDGPFLYQTKENHLLMIWSSFGDNGYAIAIAQSASGEITGPWIHQKNLLFAENGGHGMIFKTFDGHLMLVLHQPNSSPNERASFYELVDTGVSLQLKKELSE